MGLYGLWPLLGLYIMYACLVEEYIYGSMFSYFNRIL